MRAEQILEHHLVERQVGDEPFELGVLFLELTNFADVGHVEGGVLFFQV